MLTLLSLTREMTLWTGTMASNRARVVIKSAQIYVWQGAGLAKSKDHARDKPDTNSL